ncbi:MAG: hypothetical protein J0H07_31655 [Sphingobacteriales bacterium]|nr:hypothetical protein [Sphingobacteriales bacterium]
MKPVAGTQSPKGGSVQKTAVTIVLAIAFLSLVMFLSYVFITATMK